jgi:hypothetical protein
MNSEMPPANPARLHLRYVKIGEDQRWLPAWSHKLRDPLAPMTSCSQWTPPPYGTKLPMCKISIERLWFGPFSPGTAGWHNNQLTDSQKLGEVRGCLGRGEPWDALEVAISVNNPDLALAALRMVEAHPRMTGVALDLYDAGVFLAALQKMRTPLRHRQHSLLFQMMLTYYKRAAKEISLRFMKAWEACQEGWADQDQELILSSTLYPWYLNQKWAALERGAPEEVCKIWTAAKQGPPQHPAQPCSSALYCGFQPLMDWKEPYGGVVYNPPREEWPWTCDPGTKHLSDFKRGQTPAVRTWMRPLFSIAPLARPPLNPELRRRLAEFGLEVHGRTSERMELSLPKAESDLWFERNLLGTFLKGPSGNAYWGGNVWPMPPFLKRAALQYEELQKGVKVVKNLDATLSYPRSEESVNALTLVEVQGDDLLLSRERGPVLERFQHHGGPLYQAPLMPKGEGVGE